MSTKTTQTPNNFFAEDKYGPVSGNVTDATTFDDLRRNADTDNTLDTAPQTRGRVSRMRRAAGVALVGATMVVAAPHIADGARAVKHAVGQTIGDDRIFNPDQGNPAPDKMPQTQDQLPGGNEIPPNAVRSRE